MNILKRCAFAAAISLAAFSAWSAGTQEPVIEVVTLKIKPGISDTEFQKIDHAVEEQHVSRQPGFISRESAAGKDGSWLVIVHWKSTADAQASMNSFESVPAAKTFMDSIVPGTMTMTRYQKP